MLSVYKNIIISFLYVVVSFIVTYFSSESTQTVHIIWPPVALAVAFYLAFRKEVLLGIFIGYFIQVFIQDYFLRHSTTLVSFSYSIVNAFFSVVIIYFIIEKIFYSKKSDTFLYEKNIISFNLFIAPLISFFLALKGCLLFNLIYHKNLEECLNILQTWFVGDYIGIVLFTPLVFFSLKIFEADRAVKLIFINIAILISFYLSLFYLTENTIQKMRTEFRISSEDTVKIISIKLHNLYKDTSTLLDFFNASKSVDENEFDIMSTRLATQEIYPKAVVWYASKEGQLYNRYELKFKKIINSKTKYFPEIGMFQKSIDLFDMLDNSTSENSNPYIFNSDGEYFIAQPVFKKNKSIGVFLIFIDMDLLFDIEKYKRKSFFEIIFNKYAVYKSSSSKVEFKFYEQSDFFFFNDKWTVKVGMPTKLFNNSLKSRVSQTFLLLVIICMLLVTFIIFIFNEKRRILQETIKRTEELQQSRNELIKISNFKTKFLEKMSYEMRTPLNGVMGTISYLNSMEHIDKNLKDHFEIIESSSYLLNNLIRDILDITKIENDTLSLNQKNTTFETIVASVKEQTETLLAKKEITLEVDSPRNMPVFVSDEERIIQVLVNLIFNGIKFSQFGSTIVLNISGEMIEDKIVASFLVRDFGMGISKSDQRKIFSKSVTDIYDVTETNGGTGLGLSISRAIIKSLGGELKVESELYLGASFKFKLIFSTIERSTVDHFEFTQADLQRVKKYLKDKKILLVEDNVINQKTFDLLMKRLAVKADFVNDGSEALSYLSMNEIDIVFMDIRMPVMGGIEATEKIRKIKNIQQPLIVGLSANAFIEDKNDALLAGMNNFLAKPLGLNDLQKFLLTLIHDKE